MSRSGIASRTGIASRSGSALIGHGEQIGHSEQAERHAQLEQMAYRCLTSLQLQLIKKKSDIYIYKNLVCMDVCMDGWMFMVPPPLPSFQLPLFFQLFIVNC